MFWRKVGPERAPSLADALLARAAAQRARSSGYTAWQRWGAVVCDPGHSRLDAAILVYARPEVIPGLIGSRALVCRVAARPRRDFKTLHPRLEIRRPRIGEPRYDKLGPEGLRARARRSAGRDQVWSFAPPENAERAELEKVSGEYQRRRARLRRAPPDTVLRRITRSPGASADSKPRELDGLKRQPGLGALRHRSHSSTPLHVATQVTRRSGDAGKPRPRQFSCPPR